MRARWVVPWLAPVAIALAVMTPRLASPEFGLLDDGLTLETGRALSGRWGGVLTLIPETGRFFPASWLVYGVLAEAAGPRPLAFFGFNVVLLATQIVVLWRLVTMAGGGPLHAVVAGLVFASCGPAIETFYTLSKPEPLQLTWIALSLLATAASAGEPGGARRAALIAVAMGTLALAYTSKETSVVLVPVSIAWAAIARQPAERRFARTSLVLNVGAAVLLFALRWWYLPRSLAEGTYTRGYALDSATIALALFRIASWIVRDFAFLVPAIVAGLVWVVRRRTAVRRALLYPSVWMAGWLAVYAPWPATFEYYLLPFAFGAAALTGIVVGNLWTMRGRDGVTTRRWASSALAAIALLWLAGVVNATADARVQLAVDRANADLVDRLATLPRGSRVVLNSTHVNEYLFELPRHLAELARRPDIRVEHIGRYARSAVPEAFIATATIASAPRPTVRIGVGEAGASRDVARLGEMRGEIGALVHGAEQRATLVELGIHRVLCHLTVPPFVDPAYCPRDRGVVHVATFTYGWQVHRLVPAPADRRP